MFPLFIDIGFRSTPTQSIRHNLEPITPSSTAQSNQQSSEPLEYPPKTAIPTSKTLSQPSPSAISRAVQQNGNRLKWHEQESAGWPQPPPASDFWDPCCTCIMAAGCCAHAPLIMVPISRLSLFGYPVSDVVSPCRVSAHLSVIYLSRQLVQPDLALMRRQLASEVKRGRRWCVCVRGRQLCTVFADGEETVTLACDVCWTTVGKL